LATKFGRKLLGRLAQLLGSLPRGVQRRIGKNYDKLFASKAADDIFASQLCLEQISQSMQHEQVPSERLIRRIVVSDLRAQFTHGVSLR
jgi:hypothetical protein